MTARRPAGVRRGALGAAVVLAACGGNAVGPDGGALSDGDAEAYGALPDGRVVHGPFATRVTRFEPGPGAGFGQRGMPDVVLGPPVGAGDMAGSTDVVSLGRGGVICVALDDVAVVDGPGVDLVVFENAFIEAGSTRVWAELGEVSVSADGVDFRTFPCTTAGPPYTGCAGASPVYSAPGNGIAPTDPRYAGGDGYDLAQVGITRARFVCVRDLATTGLAPPSTGFDLDAVAAVHFAPE